MGLTCSDPLHIGCRRPTVPSMLLPNTPGDPKTAQPCQSCRFKAARARRQQLGVPEPRTSRGSKRRL